MKTNELITQLRSTARYVAPPARELLIAAAEELERLGAELVDERYRHDRYVDFELAQSRELAQLREERRWIPVEERLPEGASAVLAVDLDGTIATAYYVGRWHGGGDLDENAVIGWMPLPSPPTCKDCKFYEKECEDHAQSRMMGQERGMEICEIFCYLPQPPNEVEQ